MIKINKSHTVFVLVALVGLFLLTACGADSSLQVQAKGLEDDASANPDFTKLSPNDILAHRWNAMAAAYETQVSGDQALLTKLTPNEIMAYRWNAIARVYDESLEPLLTNLTPIEIMTYRWNAMADAYQELGSFGK